MATAGRRLFANAERYLRPRDEIGRRYASHPELIRRAVDIGRRCTFSLDELRYQYPHEIVPESVSAHAHLVELTWTGARERYPAGRAGKGPAHRGERAGADRRPAVRALLPDGLGPRPVRPQSGDSVPGPRLGGKLRRVLLPRGHGRESGADRRAVRAVHQSRAERTAGHRRGLRARAPRRGVSVHLPEIHARARGAHGRGDHVPAALGGARRGQSPGTVAGPCGHARQGAGLVEFRGRAGRGAARGGVRSTGSHASDDRAAGGAAAGFPAAPVAACGRLCNHRNAVVRDRAPREWRNAGPHVHRVGQGRH